MKRVQATRAAALDMGLRHVVSPRASIMGARLLSAGIGLRRVEAMTTLKGLSQDEATKLRTAALKRLGDSAD